MTSLKIHVGVPALTEVCPDCKSEMTVTEVRPLLFVDGIESVTYKCKRCRFEERRMFQSLSSMPPDRLSDLGRTARRVDTRTH
jgi:transposase-like protein